MIDARRTPDNDRVALSSWRGRTSTKRFTEGESARVVVACADLLREPDGGKDKELLFGEPVSVIERRGDMVFLQSELDEYVGYVPQAALGPPKDASHRVISRASHVYTSADMKSPTVMTLSCTSLLSGLDEQDGFLCIAEGCIPQQHVVPIDVPQPFLATARQFLGTPYLWGGNSACGVDCSGLIQVAARAAGIECPRDSDQQEAELGEFLAETDDLRPGDLVFWKGHVGLVSGPGLLLHANAHHMAVAEEPLAEAIARIGKKEFGGVTARKRLPGVL